MRSAILFVDTNILLDCPRLEEFRFPGRQVTLVVIPEVMRELRGLARSRAREQVGAAMQALASLETLARRRGSATGIPLGRSGTILRILPGAPSDAVSTDLQLVLRARSEQSLHPRTLVAVVTRDWGVAELARNHRVKSILLRNPTTSPELQRGIAEHDTVLDIDL